MIVKTYDGLAGTPNETALGNGRAVTRRFLLSEDGVGFTLSDIRITAGEGAQLWYKNHIEANYVIEGEGVLEELDTGITHELKPGVMYCLDKNDRHRIISKTDMRMICVFNPPLAGGETHDEDGAYPAA
jgi:L-ectoine synthase